MPFVTRKPINKSKRKRHNVDDISDNAEEPGQEEGPLSVEDIRLKQELRKKSKGLSATAVTTGLTKGENESDSTEAFGLQAHFGGCVEKLGEEHENDPHLKEYIRSKLSEKFGVKSSEPVKKLKIEDEHKALYAVPEHLKRRDIFSSVAVTEENPSGWTTGMREVSQTFEEKLKVLEKAERVQESILAKEKKSGKHRIASYNQGSQAGRKEGRDDQSKLINSVYGSRFVE